MKYATPVGFLLWVFCCNRNIADNVPLQIKSLGSDAPNGFKQVFRKQVDVFGIRVYATGDTPDKKVLHAANVLAQYLDNDADGRPDNPVVVSAIQKNKAAIVMFATEQKFESIDLEAFIPVEVLDSMILQDLYGEETHPNGAAKGIFDGALEEILHLITHAGYAYAYPEVFGETSGTAVAKAMDIARGGHFEQVPSAYPENAWYTYYDQTCDYSCQIAEYMYWALTSILGGQDFPGRAKEIRDEWRLNTPEAVRLRDAAIYNLLTEPQYRLPTQLPDGHYRGNSKQ